MNARTANISSLPRELWIELIDIILSLHDTSSLKSAYNLTQTCSAFRHSGAGQRVRYLYALSRHSLLPTSTRLPKNLKYESHVLEASHWPHLPRSARTPAAATLSGQPSEAWNLEPVLKGDKLYVWNNSRLKRFLFQPATAATSPAAEALRPLGESLQVDLEIFMEAEVLEFKVDEGADTVLFLTMPDPDSIEIEACIYSLETGLRLPSTAQRPFRVDNDRHNECDLAGDYMLLLGPRQVTLVRWNNPSTTLPWAEPGAQAHFATLYSRSFPLPTDANFFTSTRLLFAKLLSPQVLILLTAPPNTAHGQDWGATLELHLIGKEGTPAHIIDITLPLRSTPVSGLSYVACGSKFEPGNNGLMVISVEGYIWLVEMESLTNLIWPKNSIVRYGETPVVLETEWVKDQMVRFPIGSNDAPTSAASVSGWRLAVAWRQMTGDLQSAFVRFLDASPRPAKEAQPNLREEADGQLLYSMWWQNRYLWYWDHPAESYMPDELAEPGKAELTSVTLHGGRLLVMTGPIHQLATRVWRV